LPDYQTTFLLVQQTESSEENSLLQALKGRNKEAQANGLGTLHHHSLNNNLSA